MDVKLTKTQKEVLGYLIRDNLSIPKIALLRGKTQRSVYKIIDKLKTKGMISGTQLKGFKNQGYAPKPKKYFSNKQLIRLHGVSLKIKILTSSKFYHQLRNNKNIDYVDNNTIRMYKETLIVHISQSFEAKDPTKSSALCFDYINRLLLMLENQLGVIIVRKKYTTVKLLTWHFAEINNELAKEYNQNKINFTIYAKEDGKLWFTIDNSFNLNEAETQHPQTAEKDMIKVQNYFNDVRDNNIALPSETLKMIQEVTRNQMIFAENMKSHIQAINKLGDEVQRLGKIMNKLAQTKLKDY